VKIGLASVNEKFLRSLPFHIQTYELRTCGNVLFGDPGVLALIPDFASSEICREDAWRLLCNRIIECLEGIALANGDLSSADVVYRTVKLSLDMATSYLVFAGKYVPGCLGRERVLREGIGQDWNAPFPIMEFAAHVADCTSFKVGGSELSQSPEALWQDAVHLAHQLWRWELSILSQSDTHLSDQELIERWMACQPIHARFRGWASVLRRLGSRSYPEWPRWVRFAWKGSPRYWTYSAATQLFFQLPVVLSGRTADSGSENWAHVVSRLPTTSGAFQTNFENPLWAARVTAYNYRHFLETTAA
jgi:hypothetical protein